MNKKFKLLIHALATSIFLSGGLTGMGQTTDKNNPGDSVDQLSLGYNMKQNISEVSAAIGAVTSADLSKYSTIDAGNALFGQIPGLTVLQTGGDWWAQAPMMFVRGRSTMENAAPLVLVDGFERDLSMLSLQEIESVSVLKDAVSLALYGQRGANGVILITTKRGVEKPMDVDVSYERSVNQPFRMPEMLDAYGYARAVNEALTLDGQTPRYSDTQLNAYKNNTFPTIYPDVDWMDEVLRNNGSTQEVNATFSGGASSARYFVTLNYLDGEGLLNTHDDGRSYSTQLEYEKLNFRTNVDVDLTPSTAFNIGLGGKISGNNRPGRTAANIFNNLYNTPSAAFPVKHENGAWGGTSLYSGNPIALIDATGFVKNQERSFYTDAALTQDLSRFLSGLSASVAVSYDNSMIFQDGKTQQFAYLERTAGIDENANELTAISEQTYGQNTELNPSTGTGYHWRHSNGVFRLNYEKTWGKNQLNAMAFFHQDAFVGKGQYNTFHRQNIGSYIHFSHDERWLADVSMSYNGNNILPEGNRFAFYPAVSLGWVLSNEDFLKNNGLVNRLKLRTSIGLAGNEPSRQNLHDQQYVWGSGYYFTDKNDYFGGQSEGNLANPDIKPEKALIANVGVDARLFGKLDLTFDAFYERRSNILVPEGGAISDVLGVSPSYVSQGVVDNKGIETAVTWNQNVGDFNYYIGGQLSFARNTIVEQNEKYRPWSYLERTGKPVGQAFGLVADGFFNSQAEVDNNAVEYTFAQQLKPGDVKYVDQNGDNVIDEFDEVAIGYGWLPEMYYSFNLGAEYKGLGFHAIFQGAENVNVNLNTSSVYWPLINNTSISTFSDDRWTPATAQQATLPRLTVDENTNNYRNNTIWVRDGSFLKLRTVEVFYSLPEAVLSSFKVERGKVFAKGMNLFSIDEVYGMDPEYLATGYPTLRSFHVGVQLGF